ncbi:MULTISPECIES: hypothetical protein [Myroides]|uniref:TPM domain-containing protein n=1 Tax=Myroides odoratimimus CIP 101113 TaxID=883154 RepID=A0AAV3F2H4_9FLAO|nr:MULTISPECIES: hypothetical protein [Myroides]APA93794.1 hypothetical protein BK054_16515 [Myroides sp. ZB35]EHO09587.1 hypothetical protein HMPREF9715_02431 [Myroides odoratimimus CIP 101113]
MKKYYIPGMISIILLPLMCMWYFSYTNSYKAYSAIVVRMGEGIGACTFDGNIPIEKMTFVDFSLNGNIENDASTVNKIVNEIDKIAQNEDYDSGVNILLGEKMEYASYIRILETLYLKGGMYIVLDDKIICVHDKYYNENINMLDDIIIVDSITNEPLFPELKRNRTMEFYEQMGNKKYLILGSFLLLVVFVFRDYISINKHREKK